MSEGQNKDKTTSNNNKSNEPSIDEKSIWGTDEEKSQMDKQIEEFTDQQLKTRIRMFENNIRIMRGDINRIEHEHKQIEGRIAENKEKLGRYKQLPYLVSNVVEILDIKVDDVDENELEINKIDKSVTNAKIIKELEEKEKERQKIYQLKNV